MPAFTPIARPSVPTDMAVNPGTRSRARAAWRRSRAHWSRLRRIAAPADRVGRRIGRNSPLTCWEVFWRSAAGQTEARPQLATAGRGDRERTAVEIALDPAALQRQLEDRGAERAAEVRPPFAPVQAAECEPPPLALE